MSSAAFVAISPLDGRYARITRVLSDYFSEFALTRYRVFIEVAWLRTTLTLPPFSTKVTEADDSEGRVRLAYGGRLEFLESLGSINPTAALKVKEIEQTTNHDLKAVEYFIKQQLSVRDKKKEMKRD